MPTKKKKNAVKKAVSPKPDITAKNSSGIITTIIISLIIVAVAAAAGVVVSKIRDKSLADKNAVNTASQDTITITDTATGKTSQIRILPASAGSSQVSTTVTAAVKEIAPVNHTQTAIDAAATAAATKKGDFSYLYNDPDTKETIPHIDIAEAKFLFDSGKAVFVDARGPAEYAESHVKGSVNIPVSATPDEVEKLKAKLKGKVLVTYCHGVGCHLADKTAYKLWDSGYRKIAIFFAGWPKWNEHKYPISTK